MTRLRWTTISRLRTLCSIRNTNVWKPIPLTDMDQMKLEEASWNN